MMRSSGKHFLLLRPKRSSSNIPQVRFRQEASLHFLQLGWMDIKRLGGQSKTCVFYMQWHVTWPWHTSNSTSLALPYQLYLPPLLCRKSYFSLSKQPLLIGQMWREPIQHCYNYIQRCSSPLQCRLLVFLFTLFASLDDSFALYYRMLGLLSENKQQNCFLSTRRTSLPICLPPTLDIVVRGRLCQGFS